MFGWQPYKDILGTNRNDTDEIKQPWGFLET